MEILIVQTAFLGDLLLCIPLIKNIKRCYPSGRLTLVCRSGLGSLFQSFDLVDQIYEIDKGNSSSYRDVQSQLKKASWDLIFCPHESFRSALLVRPLKANTKIGYEKWWNGFFFDKRATRDWSHPDALRQMSLLGAVQAEFQNQIDRLLQSPGVRNLASKEPGVDFSKIELPEWASMRLKTRATEKSYEFLSGKDVFIFPGSVWPTKQWTEEGYVGVAHLLTARGYRVHWMGSKNEAPLCERLRRQSPGSFSHAGQLSLSDCYEVLKRGELLVCNDSGSMHLGAVAGIPTIAVFGPTTLSLGYRPWQQKARVMQVDLACRPCGKHGHKACPLGHHNCMKMVSAEMVLNSRPQV